MSDGVRYPVAQLSGQRRKAIIHSVYGQSNADVTEMDDPLVWDAPPMPDHIFMLDDVAGNRGGMRGWLGVPAPTGVKRLIPARENALPLPVQSYAAVAAARLNDLFGAPYRVFGVRSSAIGGVKLVGDVAGQGIWKDSAGSHPTAWNNWTSDLKYRKRCIGPISGPSIACSIRPKTFNGPASKFFQA